MLRGIDLRVIRGCSFHPAPSVSVPATASLVMRVGSGEVLYRLHWLSDESAIAFTPQINLSVDSG